MLYGVECASVPSFAVVNAVCLCAIVTHTRGVAGFAPVGVRCEVKSGGYSGGVPPLPIPNREVKPAIADGTAMQCGRVGSRILFTASGAPVSVEAGALIFLLSIDELPFDSSKLESVLFGFFLTYSYLCSQAI